MTPALDLLTDALAAYRATKLVSDDGITQGPRDAIIRWAYRHRPDMPPYPGPAGEWVAPDGVLTDQHGNPTTRRAIDEGPPGTWQDVAAEDDDPPKIAELIGCRFCVGAYVGAAIVAASTVAPRAWRPVARALALSAAAALLAGLEDD